MEDVILPDDFTPEAAQPEAEVTPETVAPEGDTTLTEQQPPEGQQEQPTAEVPKIKVKYNHEEQELGYDEAVPLIQKGMNYDKLQERLQSVESDPRLSFVEDLAKEAGMSVPEFIEADRQWRETQRLNELVQKNIPEEYAKELLESRRDREERNKEKSAQAEQAKKDADHREFLEYFQQEHGRSFDPATDTIPNEVWEANGKGVPLRYAYLEHQAKQLKSQLKVTKQNEENLRKAPIGSVTAHGGTETAAEDDFMKGFNSD